MPDRNSQTEKAERPQTDGPLGTCTTGSFGKDPHLQTRWCDNWQPLSPPAGASPTTQELVKFVGAALGREMDAEMLESWKEFAASPDVKAALRDHRMTCSVEAAFMFARFVAARASSPAPRVSAEEMEEMVSFLCDLFHGRQVKAKVNGEMGTVVAFSEDVQKYTARDILTRWLGGSPASPAPPQSEPGLIELNDAQTDEVCHWAAMPDDRWSDKVVRGINLSTFARCIVKAGVAAPSEPRWELMVRKYRAHHKLMMVMEENQDCDCNLCKQADELLAGAPLGETPRT